MVDISSWTSTNIMQNVDELYFPPWFSPDGRHILFETSSNGTVINKIYI
jgi:hypothetical protein